MLIEVATTQAAGATDGRPVATSNPANAAYSLNGQPPIAMRGTIGMSGYYVGEAVDPNDPDHDGDTDKDGVDVKG
jgi:hypothetical protein